MTPLGKRRELFMQTSLTFLFLRSILPLDKATRKVCILQSAFWLFGAQASPDFRDQHESPHS